MNGGDRGHSDEKNCHQYSKVSLNLKVYLLELFPNSGDGRLSSSNNDRGGLTDGITDPR